MKNLFLILIFICSICAGQDVMKDNSISKDIHFTVKN